jgi:hypothetical protein
MSRTGVLIFEGGYGDIPAAGGSPSDALAILGRVRFWTTLDTVAKFRARPAVDVVVVATDSPELGRQARLHGAEVHPTGRGFHFGRTLQTLTGAYGLERVVYLGGGAAPLLRSEEADALLEMVAAGGRVFVANNPQSPDLVGLGTAEAVAHLTDLRTDNASLFALVDAGYQRLLLPETPTATFDLDTPSDVLFLALSETAPLLGTHLAAGLPALGLDTTALERAAAVLARRDYPSVTLIGRVSGSTMSYLNSSLLVRLRVFSEERGMKALGRVEGGLVRSLLGVVARERGVRCLVEEIASMSEAVFWDNRVFLAALGRFPDDRDRFEADLGRWSQVQDVVLRELCREAGRAGCPIVLGGHSVVAGGIRLLASQLAGGAFAAAGVLPEDGGAASAKAG